MRVACAAFALHLTAIGAVAAAGEPALKSVRKLDRAEREAGLLPYLLYLPAAYPAEPERSWPLVVFLHGSRGRGSDPDKLAKYPVPRLAETGETPMPFVVLAPQCPSDREWSSIEAVELLIDEISRDYRVDPSRVSLVGQSMGATGVWRLAARDRQRYAAIAPMFGEGEPELAAELADVPVWIYHGERDDVVPIEASETMVEALRQAGSSQVRYTRDPNGYHRPPGDEFYAELFDWLLEHRAPVTTDTGSPRP